mmetsp:Transcript_9272/g.22089  ORF Transcript_9272/g.22089 Transcript_9272/m.22089 type:complete len:207 (+) Transcript_9272:1980-2600(+)
MRPLSQRPPEQVAACSLTCNFQHRLQYVHHCRLADDLGKHSGVQVLAISKPCLRVFGVPRLVCHLHKLREANHVAVNFDPAFVDPLLSCRHGSRNIGGFDEEGQHAEHYRDEHHATTHSQEVNDGIIKNLALRCKERPLSGGINVLVPRSRLHGPQKVEWQKHRIIHEHSPVLLPIPSNAANRDGFIETPRLNRRAATICQNGAYP